jgi:hypothetical protein
MGISAFHSDNPPVLLIETERLRRPLMEFKQAKLLPAPRWVLVNAEVLEGWGRIGWLRSATAAHDLPLKTYFGLAL